MTVVRSSQLRIARSSPAPFASSLSPIAKTLSFYDVNRLSQELSPDEDALLRSQSEPVICPDLLLPSIAEGAQWATMRSHVLSMLNPSESHVAPSRSTLSRLSAASHDPVPLPRDGSFELLAEVPLASSRALIPPFIQPESTPLDPMDAPLSDSLGTMICFPIVTHVEPAESPPTFASVAQPPCTSTSLVEAERERTILKWSAMLLNVDEAHVPRREDCRLSIGADMSEALARLAVKFLPNEFDTENSTWMPRQPFKVIKDIEASEPIQFTLKASKLQSLLNNKLSPPSMSELAEAKAKDEPCSSPTMRKMSMARQMAQLTVQAAEESISLLNSSQSDSPFHSPKLRPLRKIKYKESDEDEKKTAAARKSLMMEIQRIKEGQTGTKRRYVAEGVEKELASKRQRTDERVPEGTSQTGGNAKQRDETSKVDDDVGLIREGESGEGPRRPTAPLICPSMPCSMDVVRDSMSEEGNDQAPLSKVGTMKAEYVANKRKKMPTSKRKMKLFAYESKRQ